MALTISLLSPLLAIPGSWAQHTRVYGLEDRDIPIPSVASSSSGSVAGTDGLLQPYLRATGASQWQGIQATGSITYAGNEAAPQGAATLTITRDGSTRLDVTSTLGTTSLRIRGASGAFQDVKGKLHRLQVRDARASLFLFPYLLSPNLANQQGVRLSSPGTVELNSVGFTRLSLTRPTLDRASRAHDELMTTDFYLSPDTNLLYKSVDLVGSLIPSPQRYIRVITYEDYRQVEGVEIPFRYTETINGQRSWVLQLTTAQPQTQTDPAYFNF
jgi:hypothetical protein